MLVTRYLVYVDILQSPRDRSLKKIIKNEGQKNGDNYKIKLIFTGCISAYFSATTLAKRFLAWNGKECGALSFCHIQFDPCWRQLQKRKKINAAFIDIKNATS